MNEKVNKLLKRIIILSIAIGIISVFSLYSPSVNDPIAKSGILDLRNWNFYKDGALNLKGEWEIYYRQILEPDDFKGVTEVNPKLTGYIQVPSKWKVKSNGSTFSGKGVATYRLVIKMNSIKNIFGVKTRNIRMSNKIYVNDILIGQSGSPSRDTKDYRPGNTPYSAFFNVDNNDVQIIIQVANHVYPNSGIIQDISFGLHKDISSISNIASALDMSGAIIALFFAVYHLGIYYTRTKDLSFLYFGMYLFTLSILIFTSGEKILIQLFPALPFDFVYKLQASSAALGLLPILLFVRALEISLVPISLLRIVKCETIAFESIIIILPYSISSYLNNIFWVLNGFILVIIFYRFIMSYFRNQFGNLGEKGFKLLLGAIICIL